MRSPTRLATLVASFLALTPALARAHGVRVDGSPADWSGRGPASTNLGIVARDAMSQGELVWRDEPADTRTDLSSPEVGSDLTGFAVTADRTNLYFLVTFPAGVAWPPPGVTPQIQIAINLDRTAGSGNDFLAGFADTRTSDRGRW